MSQSDNTESSVAGGAAGFQASGSGQASGGAPASSEGGKKTFSQMAEDVRREARKSPMPVFIAALAAFLALISMANGSADKLALQSHIEAANKFGYFQAKNIRATNSQIAADTFDAMGKPVLAKRWKSKADRYKQEKIVILSEAKEQQSIRTIAVKRGGYFGIAISALQIAIVLASASMIFGGGFLLGGSVLLAFIAAFFTFNGYALAFEVPTDPVDLFRWLKEASGVSFAALAGLIGTG